MKFFDVQVEEINNLGEVVYSQNVVTSKSIFDFLNFFYDCMYNPFEHDTKSIRVTYEDFNRKKQTFILTKESEEK